MTQLKRQSLARKYFGNDRFANDDDDDQSQMSPDGPEQNVNTDLNEVAEGYSRNIFKNLFKQFQTQTSQNTVSQNYFSQSNFDFLNIEEYKKLKSQLKQLQILLYNIRDQTETQEVKKSQLFTRIQGINHENMNLINEEEKLKTELDDLKSQLESFKQVTKKELEDTQNLKRDQQKHKMKINKLKQFIADTVLNKGKEILKRRQDELEKIRAKEQEIREKEQEKREKEEEERKRRMEEEHKKKEEEEALLQMRRTSYIDPTLSSMMKDSVVIEEEEKSNKYKREKTMSPHRARPPLHQKERSVNRLKTAMGTIGIGENQKQAISSQERISVANNYTGFRGQSEMRAQRNITLVNSNVTSNIGSPDKRFNQTQNEFSSPDKDHQKNRGIQGWIRDQEFQDFSSNNIDKDNPSIDINDDTFQ
ncbi:UNKNOWN [Stylonychia lemnae]|uniref:Uncharacterized protein n=1 Tax=Stylonychia lemnae TaxID=5949 RepID=A0A078ACI6_STYLE|nr:UNKNOWN [Stylonychia lemnae]|eukprot:CDW79576.1 UNKNOWN [Stylonychia lemnae]